MASRRRVPRRVSLDMEITFQQCRGILKHAWEPWTPPADARYGTGWGYRVARICTRCEGISYCQINSLGQKSPWQYKMPDGYSMPADEVPSQEQLALSFLTHEKVNNYYGDKPVSRVVKRRKPKKAAPRKTAVKRAKPRATTTTKKRRHLHSVAS